MSAADLVQDAIDELYAVDPDDFMERRSALAADARTSDKRAAKTIAALRKPTRSAYVLNRLVRSDPDTADRLADLGAQLRAAQDALDGGRMRELSTLRRGMVEELADQAFELTGQRSPPPGLRDQVVSTLNAAVADESVVGQLGTGTLLRSARWDGFGFASPPELSLVQPGGAQDNRGRGQAVQPGGAQDNRGRGQAVQPGGAQDNRGRGQAVQPAAKTALAKRTPAKSGATKAGGTKGGAGKAVQAKARVAAQAKEAKAEEQRRRPALAEAQRTAKEADAAVDKASQAEERQVNKVRMLHEQLTDARRRLDELRIDVRRAENRQRKARQALERRKA